MSSLIYRINLALQRFESILPSLFGRYPYPPSNFGILALEQTPADNTTSKRPAFSLKDLIGDGMLWAVPKTRRTVEKRLNRKFGDPFYVWKLLKPKTQLKVCDSCGHHHEVGILCAHCYENVRKETELIKEKIEKQLKLDPVDSEVIVLYDGEKGEHASEYWKGKRIVEMERPRPSWFSKNLLQKTTQPLANTKEVKPDELG
ncbi:unnamed protein product [Diamesa serratosioi]